jgi:proteasome accessory factor A
VAPIVALFSRRQRLQLGLSDSNRAQTAEYLKIGATSLVFDMAEAGFLDDAPRVVRPADALKCFSNDPTLRKRVALRTGERMNALELQRWYLRRAEQYISAHRVASLECGEVVALWRATLNALESDPSSLVGRIDWVTKQALITGGGDLSRAAKKKIDIKYHEVGSGYFSLLERRGLAPVRVSRAAIRAAVLDPPENTPAWKRGRLVRDAGMAPSPVSWRP